MYNKKIIYVIFMLLMTISFLNAQDYNKLSIHGYGSWAYGKTDGNLYTIGSEDGDFRQSQLIMNISANPYEKFSIHSQFGFDENKDSKTVKLDYAFGEYSYSDLLKFRIGKIKQPFGIYTEVYDVGILRPFYELPQGVYGTPGFATKFYHGIGLTGRFSLAEKWDIQYDVYGGEIYLFDFIDLSMQQSPRFKDSFGGKLTLNTPLEGLSFATSAYHGDVTYYILDTKFDPMTMQMTSEVVPSSMSGEYLVSLFSLEYLTHSVLLRAEYLNSTHEDDVFVQDAVYVEAGYTFWDRLQLVSRYDWFDGQMPSANLPKSIMKHESYGFGLNYWLNTNFVIKFSYQQIDGNRFSHPEDINTMIANHYMGLPVDIKDEAKVFILGTQFAF